MYVCDLYLSLAPYLHRRTMRRPAHTIEEKLLLQSEYHHYIIRVPVKPSKFSYIYKKKVKSILGPLIITKV